MKQYEILSRTTVMENPDSLFNYFGWPSVTRLKNGRLAAAASGFRLGHVCPFGKAVIAFSEDEGKTWSRPSPVIDTVLDDRDAGICAFGKSGVILTSFNNTLQFQKDYVADRVKGAEGIPDPAYQKHENDHAGFVNAYLSLVATALPDTKEQYLGSTYRVSRDNGVSWGDIMMSPVTSPHGPAEAPDGTLYYVGNEYPQGEVVCYVMDAAGAMEKRGTVPALDGVTGVEPHAIVLPDGKILVHMRMERGGEHPLFTVAQSVSVDGGYTFSTPRYVASDTTGAPPHLLLHSSGVLLCAVGRRREPFGIRVLESRDMGETWEENVLTDDAPNFDLGYPATVELSDGSLYTVWYQHEALAGIWTNATEKHNTPSLIYGARWKL